MEVFAAIAGWLEETLLPYGGIGLMLLAICDSSFLSLPEVNDILVMTFSIRRPDQMIVYAGLTTLGSVIGCAMLYSVGRGSGSAFFRRRAGNDLKAGLTEKIRDWYRRYGMLAVIVPSVLPPPTPFKAFVFCAGAFGIAWPKFIAAVAVGRSIRYFSQGFLAVRYGDDAIEFAQANYWVIGILISFLTVAATVGFVMWRRQSGNSSA